jgi:hypothetical protein
MDDVDLNACFKSDELESRAACGEQGAICLPTDGSTLCLARGAVRPAESCPTPAQNDPAMTLPLVHGFQEGSAASTNTRGAQSDPDYETEHIGSV